MLRKKAIASLFLTFAATSNAANINDIVGNASKRYGVSEKLIHAVIKAESGYNPKAYSHAGAAGLMQLMPDTAKRYGVTVRFNPEQCVDGGTHYLRDLLDMFDGNVKLAVAGYNAGEGAVIRYGKKIPPYSETQDYVKKVMANLNGFSSDKVQFKAEIASFSDKKPVKTKSKFMNVAAAKALADFYAPGSWKD